MKFKLHNDPTKDFLLKTGAGVVLYFLGKKVFKNLKKDSTESQVEDKPEVGQAQGLRQAMNPSGNSWMKNFDGTDTKAVFSIATEITNIEGVRNAYKNLYTTSLYEDLQSELSAEEYQKFLSLATKGKAGEKKFAPNRKDIIANVWLLTTATANVRKTPEKQSRFNPLNNVVKKVNSGKLIGITTGKFVYDEPNDVVFIEFWTFTSKREKKTYYVAKSQVELVSAKEKIVREKTAKIPFEQLEGINTEDSPSEEVISTAETEIYSENFIRVGTTPKGVIVGFPLLTLDTGKGKYIKLKTVQGLIRWIKAEMAVIKSRNI